MEQDNNIVRAKSREQFESLAFIFGLISIVGLFCCFPVMFVFGALGAIFASISRGGSRNYSQKARTGLIFSIIGIVASLVMSVGITVYSFSSLSKEIKNNPNYINEIHDEFNNMVDQQNSPNGEEVKQIYNSYFEQLEELVNKLQ